MNTAITNPINLILIIIGSFLGLSIGSFLLLNKSAKTKANLFLGVLVLAITTFFLPAFFYRFDLLPQVPHVIGLSNVVTFLIGPLAYLYVRACTQKAAVGNVSVHRVPGDIAAGFRAAGSRAAGHRAVLRPDVPR